LAARIGCKDWLQVLAARTSCKDWLQGLAARIGCKDWLQGLAARIGGKDWLQGLVLGANPIDEIWIKFTHSSCQLYHFLMEKHLPLKSYFQNS
jgi:hypothetical protein